MIVLSLPLSAQDLPAGTVLEARLSVATGSRISHPGDPIEATIIAPASVGGRILVPQGSTVSGVIENVNPLGFGLKHTTADIHYRFDTVRLKNGETISIQSEVVEVETAKERVDLAGTVRGIHPIASLSSTLDLYTVPLLCVTPVVGAPVWFVKSVIAPSPNPEIYFPEGTEVILRLSAPVSIPSPDTASVRMASFSPQKVAEIHGSLRDSAQRAQHGSHPSDLVNLVFLGTREQMDRAFHAAGWSQAESKSPLSLYRMYYALTERIGYRRAPMDSLTLNGVPSDFVYQKSLDTVQKRHHVRLWKGLHRTDIWLGTAAEDVAFRFDVMHWTHSTDPRIDNERAKVVDDLAFTGCLGAAELLTRESLRPVENPKAARPIFTDGKIAVLRLNSCSDPRVMAGVDSAVALRPHGRLSRVLVSLRNDVGKSNILFTLYNTVKYVGERHASRRAAQTPSLSAPQRGLDWLSSPAPGLGGEP